MLKLKREDYFAVDYEERMAAEVEAVFYIAENAADHILDLPKMHDDGTECWDDELRAAKERLTAQLLPVATAIHLANLARPE